MLHIAHESRPRPGEQENGDAVIVRRSGPRTLLAVLDALGHGPKAAVTARVGLDFLEQATLELDVGALLAGLHRALDGTRGAAAFVAVFEGDILHYGGIGNVEAKASGMRLGVVNVPGVLGHRVPRLRTDASQLSRGSRLVVFTDGIRPRFSLNDLDGLKPNELCRCLVRDYGRPTDDATVLVAHLDDERLETA